MDEKLSRSDTYSLMFRKYPDVVDVKQLGEMLGISTKTACRLLQGNKIEHFKIGRIYKIPKIHVLEYLRIKGYLPEKE
jgi:excisionase family DNA binding protein